MAQSVELTHPVPITPDLAYVPERVWLCAKCRELPRKALKANRGQRELTSYYDALTHPEFRGLKGIRKWQPAATTIDFLDAATGIINYPILPRHFKLPP